MIGIDSTTPKNIQLQSRYFSKKPVFMVLVLCFMFYVIWVSETDSGIFKKILTGQLDFESEPWPQITETAKDLIKTMLDRNPEQRITAHQVLRE
uniref:Protein kinase domain-containing protein n=1 Tax=Lactuca sativa TaxID=4236 RepID=A0A9R1WGZ8_LACSA|nr:hypothetical protein LSAT_V11C100005040 [Lactuca sativa]